MLGKDYILINNSLNKMESKDGPPYKVILIVFCEPDLTAHLY